ncbi:MAG TPA: ankyrin repeat domain-containing protein [Phnomibacter sp.]|nr:ankyrin repeat domain-containing protein [Phnomibacter sp.]
MPYKVLTVILLLSTLLFGGEAGMAQNLSYSKSPWKEKEEAMFYALRSSTAYSDMDPLKELIEKKKYPVDRRLPSGFTPLQAMIYWTAWGERQQKCPEAIRYLISKGASLTAKTPRLRKNIQPLGPYDNDWINIETPDSLNALQLAVVCGYSDLVKWMLEFDKNTAVRDRYGNGLVHLAALYNYNNRFDEHYVPNLAKMLLLDQNQLNDSSQNALLVYVSRPQWITTAKLVITYMLRAGANPDQRDLSARNFYDYGRTVNPWITRWLEQEKEQARINEMYRKFRDSPPIDFQKQYEENMARYRAWQKQNSSGCGEQSLPGNMEFRYNYHITSMYGPPRKGSNSTEADEPIVVRIGSSKIEIEPISQYYGSFTICSSGVTSVNGSNYHLYTFKTSSSNSTYQAFGYDPKNPNNAIIMTSNNGVILLSKNPFRF